MPAIGEPLLADPTLPLCSACLPLHSGGRRHICDTCFHHGLQPLAAHRCPLCSQSLTAPDAPCVNWLCKPDAARAFTAAYACGLYTGSLGVAISEWKYNNGDWADRFAELLDAWMTARPDIMNTVDLIVGNPSARDRATGRHIEDLIAALTARAPHQPLAPADDVLTKTHSTPSSAAARRERVPGGALAAAHAHGDAVQVAGDVTGLRILLIDDVLSSGNQVNAVAQRLLNAGAADVRVLVLARTPWKPRTRPSEGKY
ncbi:phosphoribosyltransferase family protein [Streptomyces cyaneofuscatus]|uniref:ComF family protein n=1 Tax=Streptomyces cyaneofuscatus TaxID=66883 RepID=UPI0033A21E7C